MLIAPLVRYMVLPYVPCTCAKNKLPLPVMLEHSRNIAGSNHSSTTRSTMYTSPASHMCLQNLQYVRIFLGRTSCPNHGLSVAYRPLYRLCIAFLLEQNSRPEQGTFSTALLQLKPCFVQMSLIRRICHGHSLRLLLLPGLMLRRHRCRCRGDSSKSTSTSSSGSSTSVSKTNSINCSARISNRNSHCNSQ